jgi:iron uptake system component EfeO
VAALSLDQWSLVSKFHYFFALVALAGVGRSGVANAGSNELDTAAAEFRSYALAQVGQSLAVVRRMRERVEAHDLPGAQAAWIAARGGWESSEIVTAEYFPDLDRAIDAWPDATRGFHAVEARLFGAHTTDGLESVGELVNDLSALESQLRSTTLTAQHLLNGAARLSYEIGEDKAGGGESPFSGNSLVEMKSNVAAIVAFHQRVLAPVAKHRQIGVSDRVAGELTRLSNLIGVSTLGAVDQTAVREVSESLTADLAELGAQLGLERPALID